MAEKIKQWARKYSVWVLLALSLMGNLYFGVKYLATYKAKYLNLGANQVIQSILVQSRDGDVPLNIGGRLFILTPQKVEESPK